MSEENISVTFDGSSIWSHSPYTADLSDVSDDEAVISITDDVSVVFNNEEDLEEVANEAGDLEEVDNNVDDQGEVADHAEATTAAVVNTGDADEVATSTEVTEEVANGNETVDEAVNNTDAQDETFGANGTTDPDHGAGEVAAGTPSEHESSEVFQPETVDVYKQLHDNVTPAFVTSKSPSGFFAEFAAGRTTNEAVAEFSEEPSILSDSGTLLGRAASFIKMDNNYNVMNKRTRQQAKRGGRVLDNITTVPLSAFWHGVTQAAAIIVFLANVCVALADIFIKDAQGNYTYLHYKVPNFIMGVSENIALVLWVALRPKGDSTEPEKNTKHQQYMENVLHEALLYPLIVLSVFGFATEQQYQMPSDFYGWLQIFLLTLDIFDIVWTQLMRIYMIHVFVRDVDAFLGSDDVNIGGNVLVRALLATVSNFVVFMFIILLLGAQVHDDNFTSGDFRASYRSALLMVAVMILPLFNLLMFGVVNVHWLVELLLLLGSRGQTEDSPKSTELGDFTKDMAEMVISSDQIMKKLDGMRKVHPFKKFISITVEPAIAALILLWELIIVLSIYYFDGCKNISFCQAYVVQSIFAVVAVVANNHLIVVAFCFNIIAACVVAMLLVYPVTVPILLW